MGVGRTNMTNLKIAQETNQTNLDIASATNKTNLILAREENAFNERMWNETNKYNEPAKQVQRFQDAGLSAAAAAQAAGNVAAQPLRSANLANQQMGAPMQAAVMQPQEFLTTLRNAVQLGTDLGDSIKSLTQAGMENEILMTKLDADRWAARKLMQDWLVGDKQLPYTTRKAEAETKSAEGRAAVDSKLAEGQELANQNAKLNRDLLQKQLDWFDKNSNINYDKAVAELHNLEKTGENLDIQGDNLEKQGKQIDAQTQNIKQSTSNAIKQGEQIDAQTQNIKDQNAGILLDNRIKEVETILKENGYPDSFQERIAILMQRGQMSTEDLVHFMKKIQTTQDVGSQWNDTDPKMKKYFTFVFDVGSATMTENAVSNVGSASLLGLEQLYEKIFGSSTEITYPQNPNN